jgi:hypothetical protein
VSLPLTLRHSARVAQHLREVLDLGHERLRDLSVGLGGGGELFFLLHQLRLLAVQTKKKKKVKKSEFSRN